MTFSKSVLAIAFGMALLCAPLVGAAQSTPAPPATATGQATMSGRATDTGGAPLSGVQIFLDGAVHRQVTTDAKGYYDLLAPPGEYLISASKAGYEQAVNQLTLTPGQTLTNLNIIMASTTLTSLKTIGTVRTSSGSRSIFNTSGMAVTTMDTVQIDARSQPNLSKLVGEMPGVVSGQNSGGRDPNSSWSIRGARTETKVAIDGHTVSTGTFGAYNAIFGNSEIFQQVEVVKGAGINGVNAGESAFGTVNLRTRNFTGENYVTATVAGDIWSGGRYFVGLEHKFNSKFAILAARSWQNYLGPDQGVPGPVANTTAGNVASPTYSGLGLIQWQQNLSHPFVSTADLLKLRYNFSGSTSITTEYLNLIGRYLQQGASYAYNYGPYTIAQCFNGTTSVAAGAGGCGVTSTYNSPQQFGEVGKTENLYSYFPNSVINNQEPQFSFEFKTEFKNDTIFVRPYWAEIRRNIDGTQENAQPGNAAGWNQVTNAANCTLQYSSPTVANGGAKGPCFSSTDNYTTPYVNNVSASVVPWFNYTTAAPTCSIAAPCYTTKTSQQRNGLYGFGGPFSQPEFDKLGGLTFSWLHPVKENLYSLNADYSSDYTTKATADISQLPAGCYSVVGSGVPNVATLSSGAANPYYQPNCQLGGKVLATLPSNGVSIPPTWNRKLSLSLTGLWQINDKLQVGLGNYLTFENIYYQFTNPAAITAAANALYPKPNGGGAPTPTSLAGAEQSDGTLIGSTTLHAHYDPHFQMQYRLADNISLRASAGSSITTPYASLVSGFGTFRPNTSATSDSLTLPNPNLLPESTIGYDIGGDQRMKDGSVLSIDLFDNNIHNVFVTQQTAVAPLPGRPPSITSMIQQYTVNGPDMLDFGAEITMQKTPRHGLGYYGTATLERAFYYGFGNQFYSALVTAGNASYQTIVNGKQLDGTGGFEDQIPYAKGKFELNYAFPKAFAALGFVYNGNNNPYGMPAFATAYANTRFDLRNDLSIGLAAENLLNFSSGRFNGQVIPFAGFNPVGVKWSNGCSCLINGNPFSTANSAVIVQPRNIYLTITKRMP